MTTDIAARGESGAGRREPIFDASNIGLFPQLIDVIRALTDGQELLSKKLRDVRNAYADPLADLDEFRYPVGSDIDGPLCLADPGPTPPVTGPGHVEPRSNFKSGADHVPLDGPLPDSAGETSQLVSLVDPVATLGESVVQSNSISTTTEQPEPVSPTDPGLHDGQQRQPLPSSHANGTTTSPVNRDYNFFDELDARLADLHDTAD
jgi:hypothetical protein